MKHQVEAEEFDRLLRLPQAENAGEAEGLRNSLHLLRESAGAYAAARVGSAPSLSLRPAKTHHVWQWSLAMAASLCLVATPWIAHQRTLHQGVAAANAHTLAAPQTAPPSDEALFQNISDDLATSVPDAMQPLAGHTEQDTETQTSLRKN